MELFTLAIAPIVIISFYIFLRDKYEKEPIYLLLKGVIGGVFIAVPILYLEMFLSKNSPQNANSYILALYDSFIVASFSEEFLKFIVVIFLFYRNRNYNERFDGIVYSVFVSLGFAMAENFSYVYSTDLGGIETAILRMIFSVPMHALFGISMGYYLSLYKFEHYCHKRFLYQAFFSPFLIHGLYDFILMSEVYYLMFPLFIYIVYVYIDGFKKMKKHIEKSPFKNFEK